MNTFLPLQAGFHLFNCLPQSFKNAQTFKLLKTRHKISLASRAFYNFDEFLAFDLETAQSADVP